MWQPDAQTYTCGAAERSLRDCSADLEDYGADEERDDRLMAGLNVACEPEMLS